MLVGWQVFRQVCIQVGIQGGRQVGRKEGRYVCRYIVRQVFIFLVMLVVMQVGKYICRMVGRYNGRYVGRYLGVEVCWQISSQVGAKTLFLLLSISIFKILLLILKLSLLHNWRTYDDRNTLVLSQKLLDWLLTSCLASFNTLRGTLKSPDFQMQ